MVHFRKRFPVEEIAKINEFVCIDSGWETAETQTASKTAQKCFQA